MTKPPNSFRKKNKASRKFLELYANLDDSIKKATRDSCIIFNRDPATPSLRHKKLENSKHGSHMDDSYSVSITMQYRAIYVQQKDGTNLWYWIGTHNDYENFIGKK